MINRFFDETAIGIITCDRPEFINELIDSIDSSVGDIYVLNAGEKVDLNTNKVKEVLTSYRKPTPIGHGKNKLLRKMRHSGKKYLFLLEDDIRIKDNKVFQKYIETAAETGLWSGQLSYGVHKGYVGGNVTKDGIPITDVIDYEKNSINIYKNPYQVFTLYHANSIKVLGYMDDYYINALEHLDHYYKAFNLGLGSYVGCFSDIKNSWEYIEDINPNVESVKRKVDWNVNITNAWMWFKHKYGILPSEIPKPTKDQLIERLDFIEKNYSNKSLLDE